MRVTARFPEHQQGFGLCPLGLERGTGHSSGTRIHLAMCSLDICGGVGGGGAVAFADSMPLPSSGNLSRGVQRSAGGGLRACRAALQRGADGVVGSVLRGGEPRGQRFAGGTLKRTATYLPVGILEKSKATVQNQGACDVLRSRPGCSRNAAGRGQGKPRDLELCCGGCLCSLFSGFHGND